MERRQNNKKFKEEKIFILTRDSLRNHNVSKIFAKNIDPFLLIKDYKQSKKIKRLIGSNFYIKKNKYIILRGDRWARDLTGVRYLLENSRIKSLGIKTSFKSISKSVLRSNVITTLTIAIPINMAEGLLQSDAEALNFIFRETFKDLSIALLTSVTIAALGAIFLSIGAPVGLIYLTVSGIFLSVSYTIVLDEFLENTYEKLLMYRLNLEKGSKLHPLEKIHKEAAIRLGFVKKKKSNIYSSESIQHFIEDGDIYKLKEINQCK